MFKAILGFFTGIGRFLFSFVRSACGRMVEEVGDIAYDVVKRVEQTAGPGDDKFQIAKEQLKRELRERGLQYAEHILNKAIEIAHGLLVDRGEEVKKK